MSQQRINVGHHEFVSLLPIYFKIFLNREQKEKINNKTMQNKPKVKTLMDHLNVDFLSFTPLSSFLHLHLH